MNDPTLSRNEGRRINHRGRRHRGDVAAHVTLHITGASQPQAGAAAAQVGAAAPHGEHSSARGAAQPQLGAAARTAVAAVLQPQLLQPPNKQPPWHFLWQQKIRSSKQLFLQHEPQLLPQGEPQLGAAQPQLGAAARTAIATASCSYCRCCSTCVVATLAAAIAAAVATAVATARRSGTQVGPSITAARSRSSRTGRSSSSTGRGSGRTGGSSSSAGRCSTTTARSRSRTAIATGVAAIARIATASGNALPCSRKFRSSCFRNRNRWNRASGPTVRNQTIGYKRPCRVPTIQQKCSISSSDVS